MGSGDVAPRYLALHGDERSLSRTSRFTREGREAGAHRTGGRAAPELV